MGLVIVLLVVLFVVTAAVVGARKTPTFDLKRRELRYGKEAPIPFSELEVRVYNIYEREKGPEADCRIKAGRWGGKAATKREIHRVYARAGELRVDLRDFHSEDEAERYAKEIREMISGSSDEVTGAK